MGSLRPRRAGVHLRAGPAMPVPLDDGAGRRLTNQEIADLLMTRIAEELPAGRRGIFDGSGAHRAVRPPAA